MTVSYSDPVRLGLCPLELTQTFFDLGRGRSSFATHRTRLGAWVAHEGDQEAVLVGETVDGVGLDSPTFGKFDVNLDVEEQGAGTAMRVDLVQLVWQHPILLSRGQIVPAKKQYSDQENGSVQDNLLCRSGTGFW